MRTITSLSQVRKGVFHFFRWEIQFQPAVLQYDNHDLQQSVKCSLISLTRNLTNQC